jgi:hypothetical protein
MLALRFGNVLRVEIAESLLRRDWSHRDRRCGEQEHGSTHQHLFRSSPT